MFFSWLVGAASAADCSTSPAAVDGVGYPDLQAALAAAGPGALVEVCPGTYTGTFVAAEPVDLVGVAGAELTVLDGDQAGTVLSLPAASSVAGLTITNGRATQGGGLSLSSPGRLDLTDAVISGNWATAEGGGVWVPGGSEVHLSGTVVADNSARSGGGLFGAPGVVGLALGDALFEGNEARGEQLSPTSYRNGTGGAISIQDGWITDGLVTGNQADLVISAFSRLNYGGGIAGRDVRIERTQVVGNLAGSGGGGLYLTGNAQLIDVLVEDNYTYQYGGGVYVSTFGTKSIVTSGTVIRHNNARFNGGGAYLYGSTLSWQGGEFVGNAAGADANSAGSGGGLFAFSGHYEIVDAVFRGNVADRYGGGIETNYGSPFFQTSITIDSCQILDNSAVLDGGGVDLGLAGHIIDSVFEGNTTQGGGGALSMYGFGSLESYAPGPREYLVERSVFRRNEGGLGGALFVEDNAVVTASELVIEDNRAVHGGGIGVRDGTIDMLDSELGDCPDNLPDDVFLEPSGVSLVGYELVAAVSCDEAACAPAPTPRSCVDPDASSCVDPSAHEGFDVELGDGVWIRGGGRVNDRAEVGDQSLVGVDATVGYDAELGEQVQVCDDSVVRDRATLGADVTVGAGVEIGYDAELGADVVVEDGAVVRDRATVEAHAVVGEGATVGYDVTVQTGALIGANALLRDRSTVGAGAVIGEGAIIGYDVTIPAGAVVPDGAVVN